MLEAMMETVSLDYVQKLPVMELADEYPTLAGDEEVDLIASVEANGIREPLVIFRNVEEDVEDQLLDGRNRLSAAIKVKLEEIPVRYFVGTIEEAEDLIIDLNEKRRHLLPVQRAYIADKHRAIVAKRANERMSTGGANHVPVVQGVPGVGTPRDIEAGKTREILAKKHNAGKNAIDTVQRIRRVAEETMEDPDGEGEVMTPRAIKASSVLTKMQKGTISMVDAKKSVFGDPGNETGENDDPVGRLRSSANSAYSNLKRIASESADVTDKGVDEYNFHVRKVTEYIEHLKSEFGVE